MAKKQNRTIEGAGAIQENEVVELVYDPDSAATKFIRSNRYDHELVNEVTLSDGTIMEPIQATNNLLAHDIILLPEKYESYASLDELRSDLRNFIIKYLTLPDDFLEIVIHYVLLSWVYDGFNEINYLLFRGDYGSGKTRALNVVGSLLYKPLFTSGSATISPIFHALDLFRGSLILDEADFRFTDERAEISKILNSGNQKGYPVLRSVATPQKTYDPRAFHVFGPKIIGMRRHFADLAVESRCLSISMHTITPDPNIPISLPKNFKAEATALRNQLLAFRCIARHSIPINGKAVSNKVSQRGNQMLLPLLTLVDDENVKDAIISYVQGEERIRSSARLEQVDTVVLEGLAQLMKKTKKTDGGTCSIAIGELRQHLIKHGESEFDRPPSARWIGGILRQRFSLKTWKSHGVYRVALPGKESFDALCIRFGVNIDDGNEAQKTTNK